MSVRRSISVANMYVMVKEGPSEKNLSHCVFVASSADEVCTCYQMMDVASTTSWGNRHDHFVSRD